MDLKKLQCYSLKVFALSMLLVFATCTIPHISKSIAFFGMLPSGILYSILEIYLKFIKKIKR